MAPGHNGGNLRTRSAEQKTDQVSQRTKALIYFMVATLTLTCSNMTEKNMISRLNQDMVKSLGSNLVSNDNVNFDWPLLTLVKVKKGRFPFSKTKYIPLRKTLSGITGLSLESDTVTFLKDFQNECHGRWNMSMGGGHGEVTGEVGGGGDVVDKASKVTLKKDFIKESELEKLIYEKIKVDQKFVDILQLKAREELAFVTQRFYNEEELHILRKDSLSGSTAMGLLKYLTGSVEVEKSAEISFTLPANNVFAFVLQQVALQGNVLNFFYLMEILKNKSYSFDIPAASDTILELERKRDVWEALADRSDLLPTLAEILEDRSSLDQLVEALDQVTDGGSQHPSHGPVASFLDLVEVSTASKDLLEALNLLVCALEALPEEVPPALAKCGLETLDCIMHIMDHLKKGHPDVPEHLLRPLVEKEGLLWVATFLSSVASEVRNEVERAENQGPGPKAVLQALYISVRGVHTMQPKERH